jgi:hypothetical protein
LLAPNAHGTLDQDGGGTAGPGRGSNRMRVSLKRVIASLGSLAFLLLAAGAEWKF